MDTDHLSGHLSHGQVYKTLHTIGQKLKKSRKTGSSLGSAAEKSNKKYVGEAMEDLSALLLQYRQDSMGSDSAQSRAAEAQILMATAVVAHNAKNNELDEALNYMKAATIWLSIEEEKEMVNMPTTDEALGKAVLCCGVACKILLSVSDDEVKKVTNPIPQKLQRDATHDPPHPLRFQAHMICLRVAAALKELQCQEMAADYFELAAMLVSDEKHPHEVERVLARQEEIVQHKLWCWYSQGNEKDDDEEEQNDQNDEEQTKSKEQEEEATNKEQEAGAAAPAEAASPPIPSSTTTNNVLSTSFASGGSGESPIRRRQKSSSFAFVSRTPPIAASSSTPTPTASPLQPKRQRSSTMLSTSSLGAQDRQKLAQTVLQQHFNNNSFVGGQDGTPSAVGSVATTAQQSRVGRGRGTSTPSAAGTAVTTATTTARTQKEKEQQLLLQNALSIPTGYLYPYLHAMLQEARIASALKDYDRTVRCVNKIIAVAGDHQFSRAPPHIRERMRLERMELAMKRESAKGVAGAEDHNDANQQQAAAENTADDVDAATSNTEGEKDAATTAQPETKPKREATGDSNATTPMNDPLHIDTVSNHSSVTPSPAAARGLPSTPSISSTVNTINPAATANGGRTDFSFVPPDPAVFKTGPPTANTYYASLVELESALVEALTTKCLVLLVEKKNKKNAKKNTRSTEHEAQSAAPPQAGEEADANNAEDEDPSNTNPLLVVDEILLLCQSYRHEEGRRRVANSQNTIAAFNAANEARQLSQRKAGNSSLQQGGTGGVYGSGPVSCVPAEDTTWKRRVEYHLGHGDVSYISQNRVVVDGSKQFLGKRQTNGTSTATVDQSQRQTSTVSFGATSAGSSSAPTTTTGAENRATVGSTTSSVSSRSTLPTQSPTTGTQQSSPTSNGATNSTLPPSTMTSAHQIQFNRPSLAPRAWGPPQKEVKEGMRKPMVLNPRAGDFVLMVQQLQQEKRRQERMDSSQQKPHSQRLAVDTTTNQNVEQRKLAGFSDVSFSTLLRYLAITLKLIVESFNEYPQSRQPRAHAKQLARLLNEDLAHLTCQLGFRCRELNALCSRVYECAVVSPFRAIAPDVPPAVSNASIAK